MYHYFWIVSAVIFLIGVFKNYLINDNAFFINIHDTYYVIDNLIVTPFLSIGYFLLGVGYWFVQKILKKDLIKVLTLFHSVILIGGFIAYWLALGYQKLFIKNPFPLFDDSRMNDQILMITFFLIVIGMPVYFINLSIGIFRKRKLGTQPQSNNSANI